MCGLVEHRAQQGVATFGHPAIIIDLAGLVALRRQADMRADRPGMDETLRLVDRRTVGHVTTAPTPGAVISRRHTAAPMTCSNAATATGNWSGFVSGARLSS